MFVVLINGTCARLLLFVKRVGARLKRANPMRRGPKKPDFYIHAVNVTTLAAHSLSMPKIEIRSRNQRRRGTVAPDMVMLMPLTFSMGLASVRCSSRKRNSQDNKMDHRCDAMCSTLDLRSGSTAKRDRIQFGIRL